MPPRQLAENLWEVPGTWKNKFGRRMTVIRLGDGSLVIHNAMKLNDSELAWLNALGRVSYIVGPNSFHGSEASWMAARFPSAQVFVPLNKLADLKKQGITAKDLNVEFPSIPELHCIPMHGTRIHEAAFYHAPSRTLILCDLAFNMGDVFTGFERKIMRWNKVGGRFGPSRLTKYLFARDKNSLITSYRELFTLPFDRVVVNHGDVLESGGSRALQEGVREIFGRI